MAREPQQKHDDPDQSKRFIDKAKEIEADETEEGADKAFKRVAPGKKAITRSNGAKGGS